MTESKKANTYGTATESLPNMQGTPVLLPKWLDARLENLENNCSPEKNTGTPDNSSPAALKDQTITDQIFLAHRALPNPSLQRDAYSPDFCPHPLLVLLHNLRTIEYEQHANLIHLQNAQPAIALYLEGINQRLHMMQSHLLSQIDTLPTQPNIVAQLSHDSLLVSEPLAYPDNSIVHLHITLFPACLHLCMLATVSTPHPNSQLFSFVDLTRADHYALNQHLAGKL